MNTEEILSQPETDPVAGVGPAQAPQQPVARSHTDRRKFTWRTIVYSFFRPRRKAVNRASDQTNHYVDYHPKSTMWLCVGIILLAAVDAFLTMHFYDLGIRQINGIVNTLISQGRLVYLGLKLSATSACLLLLVSVSSIRVFRFLPARYFFHILFVGYLLVVLNMLRFYQA